MRTEDSSHMDSLLKNSSCTRLSSVTSHPPPTSGIGHSRCFPVACLPNDPPRRVSPPSGTVTDPGGWNRAAIGWSDPAEATCFYLRLGARRPCCEPVRTGKTQLGASYNLPLAPGVPPLPPCPARPVPSRYLAAIGHSSAKISTHSEGSKDPQEKPHRRDHHPSGVPR